MGRIWVRGRELNPGRAIGTREGPRKRAGQGLNSDGLGPGRDGPARIQRKPDWNEPGMTGSQPKAQPTGDAADEHERNAWRHERSPKLDGTVALEPNGAAERGGRRTRHGPEAGDVAAPRNQAWRQRKCDEGRETEHGAGRRRGWGAN